MGRVRWAETRVNGSSAGWLELAWDGWMAAAMSAHARRNFLEKDRQSCCRLPHLPLPLGMAACTCFGGEPVIAIQSRNLEFFRENCRKEDLISKLEI